MICGLIMIFLLLTLWPSVMAYAEDMQAPATQTVEVGIPVEESPGLFLDRSMPTQGEGKIVVFLISFPDYPNDNPAATREYYEKMYFSGLKEASLNGYDSVAAFYAKQSYGKLQLSGQVFDWYTAKHERSYYDSRKAELIMETAEYYCTQGVDFSQFDGDGDGVIDSVTFHFAGEYSDDYDNPWYQGLRYSVSGEIGGLLFTTLIQLRGETTQTQSMPHDLMMTICHELLHNLGMPDLYSRKRLRLIPTNDLMGDNQTFINPYLKMMMGWIDTVQIITGEVQDVRLDLFDASGDFVIVTDEYNGLFDEFYIVAYRDHYEDPQAVIWHIDARLNEDGTSFLYQNLIYNPKPDHQTHLSAGTQSLYPFIEEISADSFFDYVLNNAMSPTHTAFVQDSVLGPNHVPNSDTHDGRYTGIQIDDFKEHDNTYITFDVSFVKDETAPQITTQDSNLEFNTTVKILFNEHIYAGDAWENVKVLDMEGNSLLVSIQLSHYPRNELELTFKTDAYKNGYRVVLPKGAVQDSSGNELAAVTLTAFNDRYLFPLQCQQLPGTGAFDRDNGEAHFFPQEDSFVVITALWENHVLGAKVEFMRLDYDGNVLTQTIVDNPFADSEILYVTETGDGCYVLVCWNESASEGYDLLFCIDQDGQLKWSNDEYFGSGVRFFGRQGYQSMKWNDGVVIVEQVNRKTVLINSETGQVKEISIAPYPSEQLVWKPFFDLSEGKLLYTQSVTVNGKQCTRLEIIDSETLEIKAQGVIEGTEEDRYHVDQVSVNEDGTLLLYCALNLETRVFLLDAQLNIVKTLQLSKLSNNGVHFKWLENDGFYEICRTILEDHSNNQYRIRRFDRYLNLMWEADVNASFVYFFKTTSGEIMAYKSMLKPERECYIELYGSEDAHKTEHIHSLMYVEEISPTCVEEGRNGYWQCSDCGCAYEDEGQTVITDLMALSVPATGHTEVTDPKIDATCTENGMTEGKHCEACGKRFAVRQVIYARGHKAVIDYAVAPTCTAEGKNAGSHCSVCNEILTPQNSIPATGHSFGQWSKAGIGSREEIRTCICGASETRPIAGNTTLIVVAVAAGLAVAAAVVIIFLKKRI